MITPRDRSTCAGSSDTAAHPAASAAPITNATKYYDARDDSRPRPTYCFHVVIPFTQRFDLVGGEVQVAAVPLVQVGGWIVLDDDADVLVAVDVSCTEVTRAILPAKNRSWASARARRVQPDPAVRG